MMCSRVQAPRVWNSTWRLCPAGGAGEEDRAEEMWGLMAERTQLCAGTETPAAGRRQTRFKKWRAASGRRPPAVTGWLSWYLQLWAECHRTGCPAAVSAAQWGGGLQSPASGSTTCLHPLRETRKRSRQWASRVTTVFRQDRLNQGESNSNTAKIGPNKDYLLKKTFFKYYLTNYTNRDPYSVYNTPQKNNKINIFSSYSFPQLLNYFI